MQYPAHAVSLKPPILTENVFPDFAFDKSNFDAVVGHPPEQFHKPQSPLIGFEALLHRLPH
jgi:hypothetical protein